MSKLVITSDGKTREIDLSLVEEIKDNLERILRERKSFLDRSHVQYSIEILRKIKELNKKQLEYLANGFLDLLFKYADLYQSVLDNPEETCERITEFNKIKEKLKI
jgi:hypothetical protein